MRLLEHTLVDIMNIRRIFVWLYRIRFVRGFGVQSPFAFSFINDVINEHYPYYSYDELMDKDVSNHLVRQFRLFLRLANYCQPRNVLMDGRYNQIADRYVRSGCNTCHNIHFGSNNYEETLEPLLATNEDTMSIVSASDSYIDNFFNLIKTNTAHVNLCVIADIYNSSRNKKIWRSIKSDSRVFVTFDLYDVGIVFFDSKFNKQNYIVNF